MRGTLIATAVLAVVCAAPAAAGGTDRRSLGNHEALAPGVGVTGGPISAERSPAPFIVAGTIRAPRVPARASATVRASMDDYFFDPEALTVRPGTTVVWTNDGEATEGHTVTGDGFDSGVVLEGDRYSHRFANAGTFDYLCTLHPSMEGTVTVSRSETGGGGGAAGGGDAGAGPGAEDDGNAAADGGNAGDTPVTNETGGTDPGGIDAGGLYTDSTEISSSSLPSTGMSLLLLGEAGLVVLLCGFLIRELARSRGSA